MYESSIAFGDWFKCIFGFYRDGLPKKIERDKPLHCIVRLGTCILFGLVSICYDTHSCASKEKKR